MTHTSENKNNPARKKFEQMLAEQEKQIQNNKHITGLLNPDKKRVSLEEKIEKIESLVEGLYIKEKPQLQTPEKTTSTQSQVPLNKIYIYAASIVIAGLFIGISMRGEQVDKKSEVVKVMPPAKIVTTHKFALIKYGNLRQSPSQKASIVQVLHPNHVVEQVSKKDNWYQIKFFDHQKQKQVNGWIYNSVLKKL